jgi:hypothetical protein
VAAGVTMLIQQAGADHLDPGGRIALAGGAALFLACVTVAQRATVRGVPSPVLAARALAATAMVALAFAGGFLDPVVLIVIIDAALLALVVTEIRANAQARTPAGTSAQ